MKYIQKADSYRRLWEYVTDKEGYETTNEWGCHELTAKFYEVVLLCKQLLSFRKHPHTSHKQIMNSLKLVDGDLASLYKLLFDASREIRYEKIKISKGYREEFIENYESALNIIEKYIRR